MTDAPVIGTPGIPGTIGPSIGSVQVADGTNLRTLRWEPAEETWAVAEIVHGLGEHGGRYGTVAGAFTAAGIDTWAYDHRGNGGSGGPRVYVERWSILHDDLEARLTALREANPDRPLVLYGHSLGGLVACGYVVSGQERLLPDALVLSAPGLESTIPGWKRTLAGTLSGILPKLRLANGLPAGGLSRDARVGDKADADPLCTDTSTVRWGAEGFAEQDRLRALLPGLAAMPVPTYVFHGSADPIVPVAASAVLEGKGNTTRRVHDGLRHECHHEPEHADVMAEVVAWLQATLPAAVALPAPDPLPAPVPAGV
jgi:alpha-beta hydrolase superfamily lysophospholipase